LAAKKRNRAKRPRRPAFRVRQAGLKDLPILVHQRRAMWRDLGVKERKELDRADKVYERWARSRIKNKTLFGWVAESGDRVLGGGCLWLVPVQPRPESNFWPQPTGAKQGSSRWVTPYLLSMYTEPDSRGLGVASEVVETAVEWCRSNGYPQLRLHASEMGRKVYLKHGFQRTWEMRRRIKKLSEDC
jgi:GNAT superfamily N-acetyltransferase